MVRKVATEKARASSQVSVPAYEIGAWMSASPRQSVCVAAWDVVVVLVSATTRSSLVVVCQAPVRGDALVLSLLRGSVHRNHQLTCALVSTSSWIGIPTY